MDRKTKIALAFLATFLTSSALAKPAYADSSPRSKVAFSLMIDYYRGHSDLEGQEKVEFLVKTLVYLRCLSSDYQQLKKAGKDREAEEIRLEFQRIHENIFVPLGGGDLANRQIAEMKAVADREMEIFLGKDTRNLADLSNGRWLFNTANISVFVQVNDGQANFLFKNFKIQNIKPGEWPKEWKKACKGKPTLVVRALENEIGERNSGVYQLLTGKVFVPQRG